MIDVAMSGTRLFESLKAEVRRLAGDGSSPQSAEEQALIRRWNARCSALGAKLEHEAKIRNQHVPAAWLIMSHGLHAPR